jgi:hypothetical protein
MHVRTLRTNEVPREIRIYGAVNLALNRTIPLLARACRGPVESSDGAAQCLDRSFTYDNDK